MSQFRQSKSRVKGGWNEGAAQKSKAKLSTVSIVTTTPATTVTTGEKQVAIHAWFGINTSLSASSSSCSSLPPLSTSSSTAPISASLSSSSSPSAVSASSCSSSLSSSLSKPLSIPRSLSSSSSPSVEIYGPGLVLLRQFLTPEMQLYLVKECFSKEHSDLHSGTFWSAETLANGRPLFHLNMGTRGRMIDKIEAFPSQFKDICLQSLSAAQKADSSLPNMTPTTLLINFYKPKATFKWHQDSEEPERRKQGSGHPIVSFSIGLAADFGYKYRYNDIHKTMRLLSGDVLVFGGASRMLVHSVLGVIPDSMPGYLQGHLRVGRLNLTFRDTIGGTIDATEFPRYRVLYQNENSGPSMDDG